MMTKLTTKWSCDQVKNNVAAVVDGTSAIIGAASPPIELVDAGTTLRHLSHSDLWGRWASLASPGDGERARGFHEAIFRGLTGLDAPAVTVEVADGKVISTCHWVTGEYQIGD